MGRERRKWAPEEDALLRAAVQSALASSHPLLWRTLAKSVPGRTNKDCRRRWCNSLADGMTKGPWTESEDERLWEGITRHDKKWTQVAQVVKTRNSDQCASHWNQALDPAIDFSDWEKEEDEKLLQAVQECGTNWTTIVTRHLPSRTALALKNRYSALRAKSGRNSYVSSEGSRKSTVSPKRGSRAPSASKGFGESEQEDDDNGDNKKLFDMDWDSSPQDSCNPASIAASHSVPKYPLQPSLMPYPGAITSISVPDWNESVQNSALYTATSSAAQDQATQSSMFPFEFLSQVGFMQGSNSISISGLPTPAVDEDLAPAYNSFQLSPHSDYFPSSAHLENETSLSQNSQIALIHDPHLTQAEMAPEFQTHDGSLSPHIYSTPNNHESSLQVQETCSYSSPCGAYAEPLLSETPLPLSPPLSGASPGSAGTLVSFSMDSDKFAARGHLVGCADIGEESETPQHVSIEALCTTTQLSRIMRLLVGEASSVTFKINGCE